MLSIVLCSVGALNPCICRHARSHLVNLRLRGSSQNVGHSLRRGFGVRLGLQWPAQRKRRVVQASLLGVGAPEALVIAVVALLVFGPKGLAEVARTLGKSLKAFQPTIQELQQVSREFRSTLEQEIGLDELRKPDSRPLEQPYSKNQQSVQQNGARDSRVYLTEDYLRIQEEQEKYLIQEGQKKGAEGAWGDPLSSKGPLERAVLSDSQKEGEENH